MKRLLVGFSFFLFLILSFGELSAQVEARSVGCSEAVVGFDNAQGEEVTLSLFTKSACDTLIFAEDFSYFPISPMGNMICNGTQLLRLPDSYTRYSGCLAKRLYSPNGDTCYFSQEGEFATPPLDLSPYGNPIRVSFTLKTNASYSCNFSLYSVDESGSESLVSQFAMPKSTTYLFDSLISFPSNSIRLKFTATNYIAFDNLSISSSNITSTACQTLSTTADSCLFTNLLPDTEYHCAISNSTDTICFRTLKALELAHEENLSPYGADFALSLCTQATNCRYVVSRLSSSNTVYADDLLFSQIATTDTYNRAIEIYNGTGRDICLEDYKIVIDIHSGGGDYTSTKTFAFSERDTIKADSCIVVMQRLYALQGCSHGVFYINPMITGQVVIDGNDPIALICNNDTVDLFGNFAESISNSQGWTSSGLQTSKTVLKLQSSVHTGVKTNTQSGFPTLASRWEQLGEVSDTEAENFADFGRHQMNGALGSEVLDSMVVGFDSQANILQVRGLSPNTTYRIQALADINAQTYRSNSRIFRTGKTSHRTQSGDWFDEAWTEGVPTANDEAFVLNGQSLTINQGDTAQCFRLSIQDTLGQNRASIYNKGVLQSREGVMVEMKLHNSLQNSTFTQLFGFPIALTEQNSDSVRSVFEGDSQLQIENLPLQGLLPQTQAYLLSFSEDKTLVFKGELNQEAVYSLIGETTFGLSDSEHSTVFTYNPYPFAVSLAQLTSEGASMPQVLNPQTLNFVPLAVNDTLQAFEGFLVERRSLFPTMLLQSAPSSEVSMEENETLRLGLQSSTLSDELRVEFSPQTTSGFELLTDNHKFTINPNPLSIALEFENEYFCTKSLAPCEDSVSLDLDLKLPKADTYSLTLQADSLSAYLAVRLVDKTNGEVLKDFLQDSVYSFVSAQGEKHWQLRLYKTLAGLDAAAWGEDIRLIQSGSRLRVETESRIEALEIVDLQGRVVERVHFANEIILPHKGAFILRAKTNQGSVNWRVINIE